MGDDPQSTILPLPSRPQNYHPSQGKTLIAEVPRGSVSDKINFFERLKHSSKAAAQPMENVFRFNKLNKVVELDDSLPVSLHERLTGPPLAGETMKMPDPDSDDVPDLPDEEPDHYALPILREAIPQPTVTNRFSRGSPFSPESSMPPDDRSDSTRDSQHVFKGVVNESELDAICVNCLEYVGFRDIDEHSYECSKVVYNPSTLQDEIALRVKKMHRGINRRMKTARGDKLMVLVRLREIAVEITKNEQADLQRITMELQEMAVNSLAIEGGISCSIFCRRMGNLVSEKEAARTCDDQPSEDALNEVAEKHRKELIKWKAQSQALGHMTIALKGLQDIQSEVGTDPYSSASSTERLSGGSGNNGDSDVADLQAADEALQQVSEEQLKKYFYSMCLKQKLMLPKSHPKQRTLVSTLYEEAKDSGVPVSQWERFITERLVAE